MTTTYSFTDVLWRDEGVIEVFALDGTRILLVSVQFLRIGRVLSWEYILQAVGACIEEQQYQLCHRTEAGLVALDLSSVPSACKVYCRLITQAGRDAAAPNFQIGPRFHYKMRGPDEGDTGTMSHSSRSTAKQVCTLIL